MIVILNWVPLQTGVHVRFDPVEVPIRGTERHGLQYGQLEEQRVLE